MDTSSLRQQQIVTLMRERGLLQVDWLAEHFGVTPQTIRRDIQELASQSLVRRFRGGITAPSSVENLAYAKRKILMAEEKRRIAQLVATQVPDDSSLFLNIGTTTEAVAQALVSHHGLRVITNNLNVANTLHTQTNFNLSIAGGQVRTRDGGIVGEATVDFIRQFKVDIALIGVSSIEADGTLRDFDLREVKVAQTIIAQAREVWLAADASKFNRPAMIELAKLSQIDCLFTDAEPPPPFPELLAQAQVRCEIAREH
jgi:DeoR family transcriptional regulator, glycerol-3-phosphate regulon repressor